MCARWEEGEGREGGSEGEEGGREGAAAAGTAKGRRGKIRFPAFFSADHLRAIVKLFFFFIGGPGCAGAVT